MRYSPNLLEEVLRRTDIVQLVGKRVKLTRRGQQFWGCCPFHKEKSPSFKVENARRTYKCFGCGKGGDAFKWLSETEGLTFPEAVERLASEAGVELPKWSPEDEAREEKKKSLHDVVEAACVFFEEQLRARPGQEAREYLKSRGLDLETARRFRLGYAPGGNSALREHLTARNVTTDDMIEAGLVRPSQDGRPARDFFFDRLMFPISDARGRIIAFGGRGLTPDAKPKYINTGETTLFSKGQLLYNFATARPAGIKAQSIVVAEGYMDVIALVRAGFEHAVAPLGTALTEDQLGLLWRTAPEPILSFDGDAAGLNAAERAARLALPMLKPGYSLRFAFLPKGEDPDSLISAQGPGAMRALLDKAEPLSEVLWRLETEGKDFGSPERRAGLERTLAEVVSLVGDGKVADYYRDDFKRRIGALFAPAPMPGRAGGPRGGKWGRGGGPKTGKQLPDPNTAHLRNNILVVAKEQGARHAKELEIARLLLADPELADRQGEVLAQLPFSDRSLDTLRRELLNLAASGFRLENEGLKTHLVARGMAELVDRLGRGSAAPAGDSSAGDADVEAQFLRAAQDLRDMVESGPELQRAAARISLEATEESWAEYLRLRASSND